MPYFPSTDINYPNDLPCPKMSSNSTKEALSFYSSKFQRRFSGIKNRRATVSFLCETRIQMLAFETFYFTTCNDGTRLFIADWELFEENSKKEFRFVSNFDVKHLGNEKYLISSIIEENSR